MVTLILQQIIDDNSTMRVYRETCVAGDGRPYRSPSDLAVAADDFDVCLIELAPFEWNGYRPILVV